MTIDGATNQSAAGGNVRLLAMMADQAPRIPWNTFINDEFVWKPGEHVGLIGPTGQGKTTMLVHLVPLHRYVVVFATKPKDRTMDYFLSKGFVRLDRWRSLDPRIYPRRVLWPDATRVDSAKLQYEVFSRAMQRIFLEGGWTVVVDETWYLANQVRPPSPRMLSMADYIKIYLLQARALNISLVCASQRPAFIPLEIYDQSTHLFFWRDNDEQNLKRLSGISWRSSNLVRHIIANLEMHQMLYVNTRTGQMFRTRCPKLNI